LISRALRLSPPFLLAAFPVLFLFSQNVAKAEAAELLLPLVIALGAAAGVLALAYVVLREPTRAVVAASVAVFFFFGYGHVFDVVHDNKIGGFIWGRHLVLFPAWTALGLVSLLILARGRKPLPDLTRTIALISAVLVVMTAVSIGMAQARAHRSSSAAPPPLLPTTVKLDPPRAEPRRDVYYIIPEDYAGDVTSRDAFGFDNGPFLRALERRGFDVLRGALANYPRTAHSVASSINMDYVQNLIHLSKKSSDQLPFGRLIRNSIVSRALKGVGYKYVLVGSWWDWTKEDPAADLNLTPRAPSPFTRALLETTMIAPIAERLHLPGVDPRRQYYDLTKRQFDELDKIRSVKGPKFVLAHIMIPHNPYIFRSDGSFLPQAEEQGTPWPTNYVNQLKYTNKRLLEVIDRLTSGPEESRPIIVLQTDEGAHPSRLQAEGEAFRWDTAALPDLRTNLNILNAYYLPGIEHTRLYPEITPVNSFRLIFNDYFDARLPLLPDRTWVYRDEAHPHEYTDVTDKIRAFMKSEVGAGERK
jgi:hypothetical protein